MNLSADHTISTLVDALLPQNASVHGAGEPSKALYLQVRLHLSVYNDDGEDSEHALVHLIFERPTNYTKVWSCVEDTWQIPDVSKFKMTSDHDTCWRSDGTRQVTNTYLDLLGELRERNGKAHISEFNLIDRVQFVEVTYTRDPANSHVKNLTSITPKSKLDGYQGNS
jgi:hypothetical protein